MNSIIAFLYKMNYESKTCTGTLKIQLQFKMTEIKTKKCIKKKNHFEVSIILWQMCLMMFTAQCPVIFVSFPIFSSFCPIFKCLYLKIQHTDLLLYFLAKMFPIYLGLKSFQPFSKPCFFQTEH